MNTDLGFTIDDFLDMLPKNIAGSSDLNDSTKVILGALINAENTYSKHNENKGYFHIANNTLQEATGLSKKTLIKELQRLSNEHMLGFVKRESGTAHRQSHYKLIWDKIESFGVDTEVYSEVDTKEGNGNLEVYPNSHKSIPIEYRNIENRIKKIEDSIQKIENSIEDFRVSFEELNNNIISLLNSKNDKTSSLNDRLDEHNKNNNSRTPSTQSRRVEGNDLEIREQDKDEILSINDNIPSTQSERVDGDDKKDIEQSNDETETPSGNLFQDLLKSIPSGDERLRFCVEQWKSKPMNWRINHLSLMKVYCKEFALWHKHQYKNLSIEDTLKLYEEEAEQKRLQQEEMSRLFGHKFA